jgi:streptomycin 6-kinase
MGQQAVKVTLDPAFVQRVQATFAPAGTAWLAALPATLAHYAARWELTLAAPFPNLSYNYVAPAHQHDGTPVVLKLGVPCAELCNEITALSSYSGVGAVRLLDADAAGGALLLERLLPGADLSALPDAQALPIAAQIMQQIRQPAPAQATVPHIRDWLRGLDRLDAAVAQGAAWFTRAEVAQVCRLRDALLADAGPDQLLHGDLHHGNIIASARGWLAIDPKGIVGEAAYEAGALLRNPFPAITAHPDPRALLHQRSAMLAACLGESAERLRQWAAVQTMLSAWWFIEDGAAPSDYLPAIALARAWT